MPVRYELFATGTVAPDTLWALVGDPRRLPEWTDVATVTEIDPEPVTTGSRIIAAIDHRTWRFQVTTAEDRLLEVLTDIDGGTLGIGVRVAADPAGSRLILAGYHERSGTLGGLRARLLDAPAMRRRFDRWTSRALDLATTSG